MSNSTNTASNLVARFGTLLLLTLIVGIAAALRFADIATESLWVDEIYSYRQALKSVAMIIANAPSDVHPPVYYALLHAWTLLFGTTELGLRSFSAVCGILAVPCIYVLGRDIAGKRVGLYASLLLALSHFHIHYSQEARNYAYVVLVVILGMIGFVRYLRHFDDENSGALSWQVICGFIVGSLLVLYSHFFALFVIVAQNVLVFGFALFHRARWKRMWKSWVMLQALLLLMFTPWLNVLYYQIRTVKSGYWIERPNLMTLAETLVEHAGSLSAAAIILPLCALAFVQVRKRLVRDNAQTEEIFVLRFWADERLIMLLLWFALPILIPYILSLESTPIYYVKFTIPALPALLLLAAKGLDALDTQVWWMRSAVIAIVVTLGVIAWRDNRNDWSALEKEIWKEATQYVDRSATSNDAVFVHEWYCKYNCDYYTKRPDLTFQALPPERFAITPTTIERFYAPSVAGRKDLWLVLSHRGAGTPRILERIERDFTLLHDSVFPSRYRKYMVADTFPFQTQAVFLMKTYLSNDIRVLHFERKKP